MDYQPSYGFLKDCLYRSESYKVTLADAYIPSTKDEYLRLRMRPYKIGLSRCFLEKICMLPNPCSSHTGR